MSRQLPTSIPEIENYTLEVFHDKILLNGYAVALLIKDGVPENIAAKFHEIVFYDHQMMFECEIDDAFNEGWKARDNIITKKGVVS